MCWPRSFFVQYSEIPWKIPKAFCRGYPWDANFRVSLQKSSLHRFIHLHKYWYPGAAFNQNSSLDFWLTCKMLLKRTGKLVVCVCMCGWKKVEGGGSSVRANRNVLHICECSPARDETEYGSGVTAGRRRKSRASCEALLPDTCTYSKRCFEAALIAPLFFLQPARLRTELDSEHQETAERGLNMKEKS